MLSILQIFEILLILLICKSAVNWLPEGPAAGAEPSDISTRTTFWLVERHRAASGLGHGAHREIKVSGLTGK